jgi:hypothetical protein
LGDQFEILGEIAQGVEDRPHIIYEQLIFQSNLEFLECVKYLELILTDALGQKSENHSAVNDGEIKVETFEISTAYQKLTVQVASESPRHLCSGFVNLKTAWTFAPID